LAREDASSGDGHQKTADIVDNDCNKRVQEVAFTLTTDDPTPVPKMKMTTMMTKDGGGWHDGIVTIKDKALLGIA
jgi:hypothetical protein